jgi:hypothetical protein
MLGDTETGATRRLVGWICAAAALQTALTIGHFAHGAHVYEDPSRYHVVAPALVAFASAIVAAAYFVMRPSRAALWVLAVVVSVPFVGVFGLFHGGFYHALKLAMYAAGMSPERLEELFDSPDFAAPNDLVFEVTGLSTLLVATGLAYLLARLLHSPLPRRSADAAGEGSIAAGRA